MQRTSINLVKCTNMSLHLDHKKLSLFVAGELVVIPLQKRKEVNKMCNQGRIDTEARIFKDESFFAQSLGRPSSLAPAAL